MLQKVLHDFSIRVPILVVVVPYLVITFKFPMFGIITRRATYNVIFQIRYEC
jgi:hypothetical protein